MKKIILLFVAVLPLLCSAQSNQTLYEGGRLSFIPKPVSATNGARCYTLTEEGINLYDNQFQFVKTIPVAPTVWQSVHQYFSQEIIDTIWYYNGGDRTAVFDDWGNPRYFENTTACQNYLDSIYGNGAYVFQLNYRGLDSVFVYTARYTVTANGDTLYDYFYQFVNGALYEYYNIGYRPDYVYGDDFVIQSSDTTTYSSIEPKKYEFINADLDSYSDIAGTFVTQTLFNNDENYEYLRFVMSSSFDVFYTDTLNNPNHYSVNKQLMNRASGFEIVSENGNVIQSVSFEHNFRMYEPTWMRMIKIDNIFYLVFSGYTSPGWSDSAILVYRVNQGASSPVQQVAAPLATSIAKIIRDGHVYIESDRHIYTTTGALVK